MLLLWIERRGEEPRVEEEEQKQLHSLPEAGNRERVRGEESEDSSEEKERENLKMGDERVTPGRGSQKSSLILEAQPLIQSRRERSES